MSPGCSPSRTAPPSPTVPCSTSPFLGTKGEVTGGSGPTCLTIPLSSVLPLSPPPSNLPLAGLGWRWSPLPPEAPIPGGAPWALWQQSLLSRYRWRQINIQWCTIATPPPPSVSWWHLAWTVGWPPPHMAVMVGITLQLHRGFRLASPLLQRCIWLTRGFRLRLSAWSLEICPGPNWTVTPLARPTLVCHSGSFGYYKSQTVSAPPPFVEPPLPQHTPYQLSLFTRLSPFPAPLATTPPFPR